MKKALLLLSLAGASYSSTAMAQGNIYLSSGDRQVSMDYQAPALSNDELDEAINRLTANAAPSQYNTTQVFAENDFTETPASTPSTASSSAKIIINNQTIDIPTQSKLPSANSKSLASGTAPSIAAQVASRAAHGKSIGRCAMYVRKALQAAGYKFTSQASAYMYATNGTLKSAGFVQISSNNYQPQVGDVVVFNRTGKHPHGHIQIYNGSQWISDFRQPKFSPYSQHGGYSVWRDARYLDASNSGTYIAMNEQ